MSSEPGDPRESAEPPSAHLKRQASLTAAALSSSAELARKRARVADDDDVVLVSSDSQRFPFSSRLLLASSSAWQTILPPLAVVQQGSTTSLPDARCAKPVVQELPEVHLDESADTLSYLLHFLEPAPAQARPLSFPRDWELMRALERYSVWRGIDQMQAALSQQHLSTALLAPAFVFSQLFSLPSLEHDVAHAAGRRCAADPAAGAVIAEGLVQGVEETGCELGKLSHLLRRTSSLAALRARALDALRAFDAEYDCEHSCRGMTYGHLVDALTTTSKKRLRKLDYGVDDGGEDGAGSGGIKQLPECPF
ncbi:uncharacterized protein RHOBADRAFT_41238 [Rhodotorula graminis WP1]|uniref:Uncharacterized protein n=1 Tax=Rhodotorula graminis (strain WP1) TaxID=578459 RepID=A0A194SDY1_RHOGW|nr:uncharacterized protein RHOBADRAFT_41238 [Rhodotorula graminis WP1]KPV78695.1 hypothetical protein RHOBADRAFT_41238 [Rhodotorula graminis WP1]